MGHVVNQDKVKTVYDLHEQGATWHQIQQQTGVWWPEIKRWIETPEMYDPYLDEVAITRVIQHGQAEVWDNMTLFEKSEVADRLVAEKARLHPDDWKDRRDDLLRLLGDKTWSTIQKRMLVVERSAA